jgi:hypothetical protein
LGKTEVWLNPVAAAALTCPRNCLATISSASGLREKGWQFYEEEADTEPMDFNAWFGTTDSGSYR